MRGKIIGGLLCSNISVDTDEHGVGQSFASRRIQLSHACAGQR